MSGADIQVEKGNYTRIHDRILEHLAVVKLSGTEFNVLMHLFRQTYGWNRKEDRISLSQWEAATGLDRSYVRRVINKLVARKIIKSGDDNQQGTVYSFNKYVEEWDADLFREGVDLQVHTKAEGVDSQVHKGVDSQVHKGVDSQVHKGVDSQVHHNKHNRNKRENGAPPSALHDRPATIEEMNQAAAERFADKNQKYATQKKRLAYRNEWRAEYVPLLDALAEIYDQTPLVDDVEDDKTIAYLQDLTIKIAGLGYDTEEKIRQLDKEWYAKDVGEWQGYEKNERHTSRQFLTFASKRKTQKKQQSTKRNYKLVPKEGDM